MDDPIEKSKEDHHFIKIRSESAKLLDCHYSLYLLLKNKAIQMPNNRVVAEQQALNLKRKFIRNPEFHTEYTSFMNNLIQNDYAVELTEDNHRQTDGKTWYIPHHGVYHPVKHKLIVGFDCGASHQGVSLNHQLLQGPIILSHSCWCHYKIQTRNNRLYFRCGSYVPLSSGP